MASRAVTHTITFDRIEQDFGISPIRSVEVDHSRGILRVICDPELPRINEGADTPQGRTFTTGGDD